VHGLALRLDGCQLSFSLHFVVFELPGDLTDLPPHIFMLSSQIAELSLYDLDPRTLPILHQDSVDCSRHQPDMCGRQGSRGTAEEFFYVAYPYPPPKASY